MAVSMVMSTAVFIYADDAFKCKYIKKLDDTVKSDEDARDLYQKKDKQRQSYYNYYSSKKWGRAESYDLCINSAKLGVEGTVKFITQYVEDYEKFHNA